MFGSKKIRKLENQIEQQKRLLNTLIERTIGDPKFKIRETVEVSSYIMSIYHPSGKIPVTIIKQTIDYDDITHSYEVVDSLGNMACVSEDRISEIKRKG